MPIDPNKETLIRFSELPDHFEKILKRRPSNATLHRWKNEQGLETVKIAGGRYSSISAVRRFVEKQSAGAE